MADAADGAAEDIEVGSTALSDGRGSSSSGAADQDGDGDEQDLYQVILNAAAKAKDADRGKSAMAALREQKMTLMAEKKVLNRQIRNESRKRKRLLEKSSKLSTTDLVTALQIRQTKQAIAKAKAKASA
jgi:hypothetical protein